MPSILGFKVKAKQKKSKMFDWLRVQKKKRPELAHPPLVPESSKFDK